MLRLMQPYCSNNIYYQSAACRCIGQIISTTNPVHTAVLEEKYLLLIHWLQIYWDIIFLNGQLAGSLLDHNNILMSAAPSSIGGQIFNIDQPDTTIL